MIDYNFPVRCLFFEIDFIEGHENRAENWLSVWLSCLVVDITVTN